MNKVEDSDNVDNTDKDAVPATTTSLTQETVETTEQSTSDFLNVANKYGNTDETLLDELIKKGQQRKNECK